MIINTRELFKGVSKKSLTLDIHRNIKLPEKITEGLAEETGAHIGDGMMNIYKASKPNTFTYVFKISGDKNEDKLYYDLHLKEIYKKIFNLKITPKLLKANEYGIRFASKSIIIFKNKILKLPLGSKNQLKGIPRIIKNENDKIVIACLRGIFDTDFSFYLQKGRKTNNYPRIQCSMSNKNLILDMYEILKEIFKFKFNIYINRKIIDKRNNKQYTYHRLDIYGSEAEDFIKFIKPKNPRYISRYVYWKNFGFLPPKTTLKNRVSILIKNKIIKNEKELLNFF